MCRVQLLTREAENIRKAGDGGDQVIQLCVPQHRVILYQRESGDEREEEMRRETGREEKRLAAVTGSFSSQNAPQALGNLCLASRAFILAFRSGKLSTQLERFLPLRAQNVSIQHLYTRLDYYGSQFGKKENIIIIFFTFF